MRASGWSATTHRVVVPKVREADEESRCKPRSARASRTRRSVTERSRSRSARTSWCPIQRTSWERSGAPGTRVPTSGRPGYLGEGETLQQRLHDNGLDLVGGFVPVRFSEREHWDEDLEGLRHTLALFDAAQATNARPVLCDAGGPERIANPGRGGEDPGLRLDNGRWATLVDGVARASRDRARARATSPSSTITRRATSRACRRSSASSPTPTSTCCSTVATSPSPAAIRSRASRTGASASAWSTSRTRAWTS